MYLLSVNSTFCFQHHSHSKRSILNRALYSRNTFLLSSLPFHQHPNQLFFPIPNQLRLTKTFQKINQDNFKDKKFVCNASMDDKKNDASNSEKEKINNISNEDSTNEKNFFGEDSNSDSNQQTDNKDERNGSNSNLNTNTNSNSNSNLNSFGFPNFKVVPVWSKEKENQVIRIQKSEIDTLRNQIFGFDSFFVTEEEAYGNGVLFRGNMRGNAEAVFSKLQIKLNDKFNDKYELYLLQNPENEKPIAVVFPKESLNNSPTPVPQWLTFSAFGFFTLFCLFFGNSINAGFEFVNSTELTFDYLSEQLPQVLVILSSLFVHEVAHFYFAKQKKIELSLPFFVPSLQIGSFGAITRITSIVKSRDDLAQLASSGPLAGFSFSLLLLIISLLLPISQDQAVVVDASVFHDSLLVGTLAKLIYGDGLREGITMNLHPLVLSAWSSLLLNAINSIPVGEIDGGRIALALWGRRWASRWNAISLGFLGLSGIFSDVALFWVVFVIFLQRGPVAPLANEITPPSKLSLTMGLTALTLALLTFFPLPVPFS